VAYSRISVATPASRGGPHVTRAAYSCVRGMYVRKGTKYVRAPRKRRTSEKPQKAKFAEYLFHALR
jgi:hypothetical protein